MDLLDWLDKNKQWVFSGAGVGVILFLLSQISSLWRLFKGTRPAVQTPAPPVVVPAAVPTAPAIAPKPDEPQIFAPLGISGVTPDDFHRAVQAAPPLQRQAVASRYVGITVQWNGKLQQAEPVDAGMIDLLLITTPTPVGVSFKVKHSDYPDLSILLTDTALRIHGVIDRVSTILPATPVVYLRDAQLTRIWVQRVG